MTPTMFMVNVRTLPIDTSCDSPKVLFCCVNQYMRYDGTVNILCFIVVFLFSNTVPYPTQPHTFMAVTVRTPRTSWRHGHAHVMWCPILLHRHWPTKRRDVIFRWKTPWFAGQMTRCAPIATLAVEFLAVVVPVWRTKERAIVRKT